MTTEGRSAENNAQEAVTDPDTGIVYFPDDPTPDPCVCVPQWITVGGGCMCWPQTSVIPPEGTDR